MSAGHVSRLRLLRDRRAACSDYRLTVARIEPNPQYEAGRKYQYGTVPNPTIETTVLSMVVTPEQFDAIRRAALEAAK